MKRKGGNPSSSVSSKKKKPPRKLFQSFQLAGQEFQLGDNIEIKGNAPAQPFFGRLEEIEQTPAGVMLTVMWYYSPTETKPGKQQWQGEKELLKSNHKDRVHYTTLNSKITVMTFPE
eukprot:comp15207_c0_seq1/m.22830 comp15207_c0_seq1/g.22830  ORF comp15207_c0_seq1/g.22830 comp15207_c0_seq1/m.22830 type:complete len:117 (+) comp15207_c0_seq1:30-380(+)